MLSVLKPSFDAISSERITEVYLIKKPINRKVLTLNRSLCDFRQDHNGLCTGSRVRVFDTKKG